MLNSGFVTNCYKIEMNLKAKVLKSFLSTSKSTKGFALTNPIIERSSLEVKEKCSS